MQKKVLFCASTLSHIRNFHLPYLEAFHESGYEVWVAANSAASLPFADHVVELPFYKSFKSPRNLKAILAARRLLAGQRFDLVSTHTTLAAAVVRAAVLLLPEKQRPRVYNTCHGYLFHEDGGLRKWAYLLPEKLCAHVTGELLVMNSEDYASAQKHHLYRDGLHFINGMGVDLSRYQPLSPEQRAKGREALGLSPKDYVFIYAAEFSARKNQAELIRAFAAARRKAPRAVLLLAGSGALLDQCRALARELGVEGAVRFPGHISGMDALYPLCDACVSSSRIEGLPFNIVEAIACGLPVIASNIKGHRELVENRRTGVLYKDERQLAQYLTAFALTPPETPAQGALVEYSLEQVKPEILKIYGLPTR